MVSTNLPSLGSLLNVVLCTARKLISALGIALHSAAAAVTAEDGSLPAVIMVLPSALVAPALRDVFSSTWMAEASVRKRGMPVLVTSDMEAPAATPSTAAPGDSRALR